MAGIVEKAQAILDEVTAWAANHPGVDPTDHYVQVLREIEDPRLRDSVVTLQKRRRNINRTSAEERQRRDREVRMELAQAVASDVASLSESNSLPVGFPEILFATRENPSLTLRRLRHKIENGGVQNGQTLNGLLAYTSNDGSEAAYRMKIMRANAGHDAMIQLFSLDKDSEIPSSVVELGSGVWYRPHGSDTIGSVAIGSKLSSEADVHALARVVHRANLLVLENARVMAR